MAKTDEAGELASVLLRTEEAIPVVASGVSKSDGLCGDLGELVHLDEDSAIEPKNFRRAYSANVITIQVCP